MALTNYLVVWDMETGGLRSDFHEAIQIAGKVYDMMTLEALPISQGGEFESLMKPEHFDRLEPKALEVNKKTVAMLEKAPDAGLVWNNFATWVKKFNKGKAPWGQPYAGGMNIRNFDYGFARVLNEKHLKKKSWFFHPTHDFDLLDSIRQWFHNEIEPERYNMDTLREFFGMSTEDGHNAITDVRQTGALIIKFLELHRKLQNKRMSDGQRFIKFARCFEGSGI